MKRHKKQQGFYGFLLGVKIMFFHNPFNPQNQFLNVMSNSELPPEPKHHGSSKRVLKILLQVVFMVAIFAALLWYVGTTVPADFNPGEPTIIKGVDFLYNTILTIKIEYLLLAFLMYFGINLFFTIRLRRVLSKDGVKTSFGKTLLAQYAGMLTSDVTPGRSGYILTPVYLRDRSFGCDKNIPTSKSLSAVLGIQTIEFLAKVIGGVGAVVYLVTFVPSQTWNQIFTSIAGINVGLLIAVLGIALMLTGAIVLALFTWSQRAISVFDRVANWRFLKRFTGGLMGKLEEYKDSAHSTRRAIPEIAGLTLICWIFKGFEWYFLGYALGITQIPWIAYFLIHPLVTALAFVPITPAGAGVQEFGIIGIFGLLLNVPAHPELVGTIAVFALLARGLLIFEDLAGIPQIVKSTSLIFSRKKPPETTLPPPAQPL
ncbi:MAG: flippase-like domain-containing protein [Chloroflexi bacterium]|nr:flippase-like domain-containing protein [Chloroflexota bacterium]